jgi:hypothetical protein
LVTLRNISKYVNIGKDYVAIVYWVNPFGPWFFQKIAWKRVMHSLPENSILRHYATGRRQILLLAVIKTIADHGLHQAMGRR